MISNKFDLIFSMIMVINLEHKVNRIKLVYNHFDLKIILNYIIYFSILITDFYIAYRVL